MIICDERCCTGCGACVSACPNGSIQIAMNACGESCPSVDDSSCVRCGKCLRVCPNNIEVKTAYPLACWAAYRTDRDARRKSATGGIGALLAEYVVGCLKGVAYGSCYDKNLKPIIGLIDKESELERLKGSRYVQSEISPELFKSVRERLEKGNRVIYFGTPCQIAGLKSYLAREYESLLTVDLMCHGVCGSGCFLDEVGKLKRDAQTTNITDIRFRGNDDAQWRPNLLQKLMARYNGNNYALTLWDGAKRFYQGDWRHNPYLAGFVLGVSLRENCYACRYARPERIGDLTIGDFIGLGKSVPFTGVSDNASCVLVNTEKGREVWAKIVSDSDVGLFAVERAYEERLVYRPSLLEPSKKHRLTNRYRSLCSSCSPAMALRSVLRWYLIRERVCFWGTTYLKVVYKGFGR